MHRAEIDRHLDEIIDFAELSTFIDTPVKRYSSGMYMRLAFSVAAHLDTDVLLIDEVLAVGDYKFQEKCLNRIGSIAEQGRTIVFVSHNLLAVRALCSRVIWMHKGKVEADGPTDAVIGEYLRRESAGVASRRIWPDDDTAPGDHQLRLRSASIQAADSPPDRPIDVTTPFVITAKYDNFVDGAQINLAIVVVNEMGSIIFSAGPTEPPFDQAVGRYSETCHVPGNLMNDGSYFISVEVRDRGKLLLSLPAVLTVSIEDSSEGRHGWFGKWEGAVRPLLQWTTERL